MIKDISVNLGFDIGIASVGWAVLNNANGKILESGVSIFPSASAERNAERRSFRQSRRLVRRRNVRLHDMKDLLEKAGFPYPTKQHIYPNPYELRVKGLTEQLTKEELALALYHLVKRRGISYDLKDVEDETGKNSSAYQESLQKNQTLLKRLTPGEIQLNRLKNEGKVRGQIVTEDEGTLLNVFPTADYRDEAMTILSQQQAFYPNITDEFIKQVSEIITRKREYFKGPGSLKSPTDYGIYKKDGTVLDNLFEILIGKDKIFPDEYRAASNSYTAQLFNLLNDLNNLRIDTTEDGKLTTEHKEEIIHYLKTTDKKKINMLALISQVTGAEQTHIKGFRIDRDDKPEWHSLAIYRKICRNFAELGIDVATWPTTLLDDLGRILTLNTENGEIRRALTTEKFKEKYPFLTESLVDTMIQNKQWFHTSSNQKWHSFSLKTMSLLIPEMLVTSKEQMTLLYDLGLIKEKDNIYETETQINLPHILADLYNPVVRKSVKQTMKIFNALYQKYPNIQYIAIEMPRDTNEEDEKKQIKEFQKKNEQEKDKAYLEFLSLSGVSETELNNKIYKNKKLRTIMRLWYQQQGICPYSGKPMPAEDILSTPNNYEIDHIIPISVSFDDSMNNKVLCFANMNQEKGKSTPYEMMQNGHGQSFASLKAMVAKNKRMDNTKKKNLLFTEKLSDIDVRKRFIARNLVDTRYASRVVLNELQQFVKGNQLDTKVTVVRGKFTSVLRKRWSINKTRDTHHHHAIDAAVIAVTPTLRIWKKENAVIIPKQVGEHLIDEPTGEILDKETFEREAYTPPFTHFLEDVRQLAPTIKFTHQVDKKMNRKISDATIYSTRQVQLGKDKQPADYVLDKIKDIYSVDGYKKFVETYKKDKAKFMMYRIDPKTFELLEQIVATYPDYEEVSLPNGKVKRQEVSPFELYRRQNGWVKKYSKKQNGPAVKQLKYYNKKLGSKIDITPKNVTKGKKVVLQSLSPWRTDIYYNDVTSEYEIMGIKYSDLTFGKCGQYGIKRERYEEIKTDEKVSAESCFMFSLYRNDRIKVIDTVNDETVELLFGSRTLPNQKGYVELKPIDKAKFDSKEVVSFYGSVTPNGQFIKRFLKKNYLLYKINTDVLGNPFYVKKEGENPRDIIDNN
ncbi:type II CRISPR RNA-guided endonuclease Cas9 [Vagococcus penaei]|uniref:CRISPR-associated endonuclease Cas9 n=1 Tax=Vagococcus penaei TaxID=633807 RepID=A0A1Q2D796_9ENTE|nr:type II CRISPR RNA-guided endonuclease Cas9 [Vagococcus penaei]AQP54278.1 type II CRISPR RNA-guided endonuclease Cas9 [Vagococcus penaei]RSU05837.1 type II CRISPR RNA-guided endonuclease Cas9 [Vagococcus penaei]